MADFGDGRSTQALAVAAEVARHPPVHLQAEIASGEIIPGAVDASRRFIKYVRFGEALQSFLRRAILRVGRDLPLFPSGELFQFLAAGAKAELAVEPERTGIEGLVVVLSDLIGIDGNCGCARERRETTQRLRINPCGLALAVRVKRVEAHLDPFAEADGFDVVDGHSVLEGEASDVGA